MAFAHISSDERPVVTATLSSSDLWISAALIGSFSTIAAHTLTTLAVAALMLITLPGRYLRTARFATTGYAHPNNWTRRCSIENRGGHAMPTDALGVYLNDHLAGSVIALELLEHLRNETSDSHDEVTLASIQAAIEADRQTLEDLITALDIDISQPRQALAWVTEKLGQVKLRIDDPSHGALRRLEALETVAIGISGKRALWRALEAIAAGYPTLYRIDFPTLLRRADEQLDVVEGLRLKAARDALSNNQ